MRREKQTSPTPNSYVFFSHSLSLLSPLSLPGVGSADYKQHYRSIVFNLKDPQNPDLRARVLARELGPAALATAPPEALASRERAAWRAAQEAAALRNSVVDEATAAQFSTAAAMAAAAHTGGGGGGDGGGGAGGQVDWRDEATAAPVAPADAVADEDAAGAAVEPFDDEKGTGAWGQDEFADAGAGTHAPPSPHLLATGTGARAGRQPRPAKAVDWGAIKADAASTPRAGGEAGGGGLDAGGGGGGGAAFKDLDAFKAGKATTAAAAPRGAPPPSQKQVAPPPARPPGPDPDVPVNPCIIAPAELAASGPGAAEWRGLVVVGEGGGGGEEAMAIPIVLTRLAGGGALAALCPASSSPPRLNLSGRLPTGRLAGYVTDLARSRTRTVTLAVARPGLAAGAGGAAALAAVCAALAAEGRVVFAPAGPDLPPEKGVEVYGVPGGGGLARGLVGAGAQRGGPGLAAAPGGVLLLALVHRRPGLEPAAAPGAAAAPPPAPGPPAPAAAPPPPPPPPPPLDFAALARLSAALGVTVPPPPQPYVPRGQAAAAAPRPQPQPYDPRGQAAAAAPPPGGGRGRWDRPPPQHQQPPGGGATGQGWWER